MTDFIGCSWYRVNWKEFNFTKYHTTINLIFFITRSLRRRYLYIKEFESRVYKQVIKERLCVCIVKEEEEGKEEEKKIRLEVEVEEGTTKETLESSMDRQQEYC